MPTNIWRRTTDEHEHLQCARSCSLRDSSANPRQTRTDPNRKPFNRGSASILRFNSSDTSKEFKFSHRSPPHRPTDRSGKAMQRHISRDMRKGKERRVYRQLVICIPACYRSLVSLVCNTKCIVTERRGRENTVTTEPQHAAQINSHFGIFPNVSLLYVFRYSHDASRRPSCPMVWTSS